MSWNFFSVYCTIVLFQCIRLQNLHTRKKGIVCHGMGVGGLPHQATWLAFFFFLINYSLILAYHPITCLFSTNSATMLMDSDIIYSWHHHALSNKKHIEKLTDIYCTNFLICVPASFAGKIYTYHRSEHSPGVRFCKYLRLHLLTGRHVCFSYFAFTFCLLPVSITLIFYRGLCA